MTRFHHPLLLAAAVAIVCTPAAAVAQASPASSDSIGSAAEVQSTLENALSAAPPSVAEHASVRRLDGTLVREGSNGWTCMPDPPQVPNDSPMCLDSTWIEVIDALQNRRTPDFEHIGISYMLQGDMPVSNSDPYATGPTADNDWLQTGVPHIMVVVPDASILDNLPTDAANGGPWVMWKGTPYAHIMIPTIAREP